MGSSSDQQLNKIFGKNRLGRISFLRGIGLGYGIGVLSGALIAYLAFSGDVVQVNDPQDIATAIPDIKDVDKQKASSDIAETASEDSVVDQPSEETTEPVAEIPKEDSVQIKKVTFDNLTGWQDDDLEAFQTAFIKSCNVILKRNPDTKMGRGDKAIEMTYGDWQPVCESFLTSLSDPASIYGPELREFLEDNFQPFLVSNNEETDGKFTGYFEAELRGSRSKSKTYKYPLLGKPKDLVSINLGDFSDDLNGRSLIGRVGEGQKFNPYFERRDIEAGKISDQAQELLWIDDPVDVFLLQVQGSGRVVLDDGTVIRVGYAAHNGHGYKSIGRYLIEQGEIEKHKASWNGIRDWIEKNPERQAELFAQNPRFVFFRILEGDGPIGSQGVALTAKRSLAVDQRYVPLGVPLWLDTVKPGLSNEPMRRLMLAQDTGGAIKGPVRGDFFWGYGDKALAEAGRMNSQGRYYALIPNDLAEKLQTKMSDQ